MFLKLKVQQCWGEDPQAVGKENVNSSNVQSQLAFAFPLSHQDKAYLRENIFKALDSASSKTIQSALCNVIYNIAQVDFPENWKSSVQEVGDRLKASIA